MGDLIKRAKDYFAHATEKQLKEDDILLLKCKDESPTIEEYPIDMDETEESDD
jgi:hypothetical protein